MQQNAKELSASRALLHPLKIAVIRNSPASRQTAWCWASFMLRFGAFLRIKSPMCRSFFYAVLTYCALPITVTARSWSKNEHFSLYREFTKHGNYFMGLLLIEWLLLFLMEKQSVKAKLFCPEIAGLFCRIAGLFCHDSRANLSLKPVCFGIAIS